LIAVIRAKPSKKRPDSLRFYGVHVMTVFLFGVKDSFHVARQVFWSDGFSLTECLGLLEVLIRLKVRQERHILGFKDQRFWVSLQRADM